MHDPNAGYRGSLHRSANGSVRIKLAPPFFSSSLKSPFICRANRRESAKPSPTPGAELAASRADLENGRKSLRDSAEENPGPWSDTRIIATDPFACALT